MKLPRKGILKIIKFLLNKKILIEGSRLSKKSCIKNQYRQRIYNYIKNNIGSNFTFIRENVLLDDGVNIGSPGQFAWHLEILLKFNYIKKIKFKKYTIFVPIDVDERKAIFYFLLREKNKNAIINLLSKHDTLKKSDIYKILNEPRENIYYHINSLLDEEIVIHQEKTSDLICINPDIKEIVFRIAKKIKTN